MEKPADHAQDEQTPGESRATPVQPSDSKDLTLSYARTLSWLSLLFILATTLSLSFFIANSARETLLTRQKNFAGFLVVNLNHQMFRRFFLPTVFARGHIALRDKEQYERLDKVVQSVIQGLPVQRLRIYDFAHRVAYSTDQQELGKIGLAPDNLDNVLEGESAMSEIVAGIPAWQAPFRMPLDAGSFVLRVLYPLRGELEDGQRTSVMGVLELTQDITGDYEEVVTFQWVIVLMSLLSSIVLFVLMLALIHRAERVLAQRMARNRMLENELHSNERLASMGRVVASIAHEIRNPLGIIRSSAELLHNRTDKADAGTRRILSAIYDESLRLSRTVNDFLDYARPRRPRQDMTDINLTLNQALGFLEGEMDRHGVVIERDTAAELYVRGDKELLYRAFYNILVNGQQAMDGRPGTRGGTLRITGRLDEKGHVCLEFLDSGPGFDPVTLPHLLDPFFTTKEAGTGLGLPIVHSIISSHGGQIELINGEGGGALVRVLLPAAGTETI
ncbi:MAG: two-component sensor histidine kinase [Desulfovibrio sp.]|jgi:signal transduction histidine kinase|nr:two-component sensor histidine kinase [Desulfovibrio sp.]